jgi:carbon-monoxide dehydrogenase medium subunit
MKPAAFTYSRPASVEEAAAVLAAEAGSARALSGGQTLGPMLNLRVASPSRLVDVGRLAALKRIERRGNTLVIGAGVTHATLEDRDDSSPTGRLLAHVASTIAYRAVRNRGTVGGSLAHADPAADWITTMTLLEARLIIVGADGRRTVAMRDYMKAPFTTAIGPGEVLVEVEIDELSSEARWGYYKVCRKVGEFPHAVGAVVLDPASARARVIAGALDSAPAPLPELAARVAQQGSAAAGLDAVTAEVARVAPHLDPVDLQIHAVAVRRAILQAVA